MKAARLFFDELNRHYLSLHHTEGKLYWATHTGQSDAHHALASAALARRRFMADAGHLAQCQAHLERLNASVESTERDRLIAGLRGWIRVFEGNAVATERAVDLLSELAEMDADLFAKRQAYTMYHVDATGERVPASPAALRGNLAANPDEDARKSSHSAMQALERWILEAGFLEIVRRRNALARELGYRNFFEYRLRTNSGISPEQLFAVFDEFEAGTREAHHALLRRLAQDHGTDALQPHDLAYRMRSGSTPQSDAYFPFEKALERWAESFRRMGVSYRGAQIEIDLLDRPGKFPTGFCIAPTPSYHDDSGAWVAADVRFTSTARPQQAGAGLRGLNVLFHEAGHAAHFSNVTRNSPCFSQEYAPSTPAFQEAQAKFFDALPADPCWMKRYAYNLAGEPMPDAILRERIEQQQAFRAYAERTDLIPTYFEAALYEMDDAERSPDAVLELARSITQRIMGIAQHTGYVLTLPHPIYHDIAVYYHGYLLAKMAAAQTHAYLTQSLGYVVDNPAVGPLLARHCWAPGNSVTLDQALQSLTGEPLTASYLVAQCNDSPESAWRHAQASIARSQATPSASAADLDASISIVHGGERIATNHESLTAMYAAFETWIDRSHRTS